MQSAPLGKRASGLRPTLSSGWIVVLAPCASRRTQPKRKRGLKSAVLHREQKLTTHRRQLALAQAAEPFRKRRAGLPGMADLLSAEQVAHEMWTARANQLVTVEKAVSQALDVLVKAERIGKYSASLARASRTSGAEESSYSVQSASCRSDIRIGGPRQLFIAKPCNDGKRPRNSTTPYESFQTCCRLPSRNASVKNLATDAIRLGR